MLVPAVAQSQRSKYLLGAVTSPRGCYTSVQLRCAVHIQAHVDWPQRNAQEGIANRLCQLLVGELSFPFGMAQLRPRVSRTNQGGAQPLVGREKQFQRLQAVQPRIGAPSDHG